MLPLPHVDQPLRTALEAMARQPLHAVLNQRGILQVMARDLVLQALREEVRFTPEELHQAVLQVCAGLPWDPPGHPQNDWITTLPDELRDTVQQRWDFLRLQKALEQRYGERVEAHFLERRQDLEQVVFRLMRLPQQGLAEELYLRLVDDDASFGELSSRYSVGDEKQTRGIVGPVECGQLHATLRRVLASLAEGETHPPFLLDQAIVLVRLQHRRPASLNDGLRQRLLEELLQPELQASIEASLLDLLRALQPMDLAPPPVLTLAAG